MNNNNNNKNKIEVISISNDPKNALNSLGARTRIELLERLNLALQNKLIVGIVLVGTQNPNKRKAFCAGADIREFDSSSSNEENEEEEIPSVGDVCLAIEGSFKPIVAAIDGVALGGGLELALSCHYRICSCSSSSTKLGLPEVNVGLIPGAGGTQRLPRLCGIDYALDVVTKGRANIQPKEALHMGLIDAISNDDENVVECAKRWALWASHFDSMDFRRTSRRPVFIHRPTPSSADAVRQEVKERCEALSKKMPPIHRGGEAVQAAITAIAASAKSTFEEGMAEEERLFYHLLIHSAQGRARRHAFFAERIAQSSSSSKDKQQQQHPLLTKLLSKNSIHDIPIGIVGAGTMGSGIAYSFLRAGFHPVILMDNHNDGLQRGLANIQKFIQADIKRSRLSKLYAKNIQSNLQTTTNLKDLAPCQVIVEAAFENLSIKQSIFSQLDSILLSDDAILATNTSSLDVSAIASTLSSNNNKHRKDYVVGMHSFSPAHVMKLVEIVTAPSSSRQAIDVIRAITKKLGKVGVVVGNCDGFVGNRMLVPYSAESAFVLTGDEYVEPVASSVKDVDDALVEFGMALGPFQMGDLAGNDIGFFTRKERGVTRDPKTGQIGPNRPLRYTEIGDDLVMKLGRVGQKVLKGWYDYDLNIGKGRKPIPSLEISKFIQTYHHHPTKSSSSSSSRSKLTKSNIIQRILYPLVNEGFKILEENIANNPSDIDVIYLYGYGWPIWRGGPMYWADHEVGLNHLLKQLQVFQKLYPGSSYFVPSSLLRTCVEMNLGVGEYYKRGLHKKMTPKSKL